MKGRIHVWLLFVSLFLFVVGGISWLIGTNSGARFLVNTGVQYVPGTVEIAGIRGTLAGKLDLEGVRMRSEDWDISVNHVGVKWTPLSLLAGWLRIRHIVLEGLSVNNLQPDTKGAIELRWPRVSGILSWLRIRIKSFRINRMVYKQGGRELFSISGASAMSTWYLGGLKIRVAQADTSLGTGEGTVGASFTSPMLASHFRIKAGKTYYGLDEYTISLELQGGRGTVELVGPVSLIGFHKNTEMVKLAGRLALDNKRIVFDNFQFKEMGRQGTVDMTGFIDPSVVERPFEVAITIKDLSISKDVKSAPAVSGSAKAAGDESGYKGTFDLHTNDTSWKNVALAGNLNGDWDSAGLTALTGKILDGSINGSVAASWKEGFALSGALSARRLNPARITVNWPGTINADVSGSLNLSRSGNLEGIMKVNLLESVVRKKPLTGRAEARWDQGLFRLSDCELHGRGFDLSAHGVLQRQLNYQVRIDDLGGVIPEGIGRLNATGWVQSNSGRWSAVTQAEGGAIRAGTLGLDSFFLAAKWNEQGADLISARFRAKDIDLQGLTIGSLNLIVDGRLIDHEIKLDLAWPKSTAALWAKGGYTEGLWSGAVVKVEGRDTYAGPISLLKSATLKIGEGRLVLGPLVIVGASGERIEIGGEVPIDSPKGNIKAAWEKVNLRRFAPLLNGADIEGQTSGKFEALHLGKEQYRVNGALSGSLNITRGPGTLRVTDVNSKFNWDSRGLNGDINMSLPGGARIAGYIASNEGARLGLPESASLSATWRDMNTDIVKPWMPKAIEIGGRFSGNIEGKLLPGTRLNVSGESRLSGGSVTWRTGEGLIKADAEKASMGFAWKESTLKGNVELLLPSYGKVSATFALPVPAQLPVRIQRKGATEIVIGGEVQEKGIISVLFPDVIEESRGRLVFEVKRGGAWETPDTAGNVKLTNGGGYVPSAGIRVRDVALDAVFMGDRIEVSSFSAHSGPGSIHGKGTFWFGEQGLSRFTGRIRGDKFLAVFQPELQVQISPDMTIEGMGNKIVVRGAILVPEALVRGGDNKDVAKASADVVIVDRYHTPKTPLRIDLDGEVTVIMGDKVKIQAEGLDSRIEGRVVLYAENLDTVRGKGDLRLVKGKFSSYGVKLDLTRGNIIFDGGPVTRASLDVMALRTFNVGRFDETKVGVTVTGTPGSPLIKLYSEPSMPDTDILSYMVFGRSLQAGQNSDQTTALLRAAGGILGGKRSSGLQDQIQQRLGIDTLEVQEETRSAFTSSRTLSDGGTINRSFVTIGKYLSPRLYIGYGRSVFADAYLLTARFSLLRNLEIESKTGLTSSVDLIYKVEFN